MPIIGIGTDIIEIDRVKKAASKDSFVSRYFTANEKILFSQNNNNANTIAGNFAAKESLIKAFGGAFNAVPLIDMEVLRDSFGKPYIELKNSALKIAEDEKISNIFISISHNNTSAIAMVVIER